jgi:pimeloyl-ACP methyl ester carboxylesterase
MTTTSVNPLLQAPLALLATHFAQRLVRLPSGARVAVRSCGVAPSANANPTVVLLHGISSGAASWLYTAQLVGQHTHVIAWDAPGYGESTPLDQSNPTDGDYAARLHELLLALGVTRCVLVGHSLGALMAAAYLRGPGAVQVVSTLLISPAGGYGAPNQQAKSATVRHDRQQTLSTLGVAQLAERTAQRLLSPHADAATRAWVQWNAAQLRPAGYLQAVELLCGSDLGQLAGHSGSLVIHCGEADIVTPPSQCETWADLLKAPFSLIAHAGHASPSEQPGSVAALILNAAVLAANSKEPL